MRTKLIPAVAGLGLALLLAATATAGADAGEADDSVLGASAGSAVTVPLVAEIPSTADVDRHRPAPGPTAEELAAFASAQQAQFDAYVSIQQTKFVEYIEAVTAPPPPPPAPPAPAPAPVSAAPGSVQDIIARHFGGQTEKAIAVARCESGLNPGAASAGGGNHGLFQINNVHSGTFQSVTGAPWSARYDADTNTRFAKWLYDQSGWGPWACA